MLVHMPAVCLRSSTPRRIYSHSNQLQRGFTQNVALWKCSQSQAVSYRAKMGSVDSSHDKLVKSYDPRHMAYFCLVTQQLCSGFSTGDRSINLKLRATSCEKLSGVGWNLRRMPQKLGGTATGLCLCFAVSGIASAEGPVDGNSEKTQSTASSSTSTHGKKVYTDYSVTGIPGDGRCLFRSVAHGACIRSGKPIPNEDHQRRLADELRAMVADEFVKRRAETEWFVEGDFDTYVSQIRKPHVWGGEPELFMASHVLQTPITVYMHDEEAGGLIAIAEYGQEYGKEDPIQVLYHGFGHYDALQIPVKRSPKSRL